MTSGTLFTGAYRVSKRVAESALSDLFGVKLSLGSVSASEQTMSAALAVPVAEARTYVQQQAVVHADETGWREERKRAWLWIAGTTLVTVFLVHTRRGAEAARSLLGTFAGILVTDRWAAYNGWPLNKRQLCWAHLLRDFTFISQSKGTAGSVGKALPNVQVRMEHYETGEACDVKEIGKILVKGDSVMSAYFDDFEATTQHIRRGWYDTEDMGYRDDEGYLWHVGRLGRFLKIGGEMVSLVQVEDLLQRGLPDTVECGVVEVPDAVRGAKIVAAVTQKIDEKAAAARLSETLPRIAVPKQFVVLPFLPKMPSGKVDYRALTEMVRDTVQAGGSARTRPPHA